MWIEQIHLVNYRQHRDRLVTFSPNMNLILGPIGSGKTNILEGAYWNLTNQSRGSERKDDISQFAKPTDPAFVDIKLHHGGKVIYVHRGMRPIDKSLRVDTGRPFVKEAEIKEEIERILGASIKIIDDYIFVEQDQVKQFIKQTPAARGRSLQVLFGTEKAERCWNDVGSFLTNIRVPLVTESEDTLRTDLIRMEGDRAYKTLQAHTYDDIPDKYDISTDPNHRIVQAWGKQVELGNRRDSVLTRLQIVRQKIVTANDELAPKAKELEELIDHIDVARAELEKLEKQATQWDQYVKHHKTYDDVVKQLETTVAFIEGRTAPAKPDDFIEDTDLHKFMDDWNKLQATYAEYEQLVTQFKSGNVLTCPTCKQPTSQIMELVEQRAAAMPAMYDDIHARRKRLESTRWHTQRMIEHKGIIDGAAARADFLRDQLARMPATEKPVGDDQATVAAQLVSYRDAITQAKTEQKTSEAAVRALQESVDRLVGTEAALSDELLEITKQLDPSITETQASNAQALLSDKSKRFGEKVELLSAIKMLTQVIDESKARLQRIEDARRTAEALDQFRGKLILARDILHRDKLPRVVAQSYLEILNEDINSTLRSLDSPFYVEPIEGLDFKATFRDGRSVPIARLSGGEKTIFAIAFRLVVNSTFAKEVGLLCLDEPTAGLPPNDVESMKTAFDRLRELSKQRNLQVIMISHERGLARLFDNVIELPPIQAA